MSFSEQISTTQLSALPGDNSEIGGLFVKLAVFNGSQVSESDMDFENKKRSEIKPDPTKIYISFEYE